MKDERIMQIAKIYDNLVSIHKKENENHIKLDGDITEYFENLLVALKIYIEKLTKKDMDLLELIAMFNRLAFQYSMEKDDEDND